MVIDASSADRSAYEQRRLAALRRYQILDTPPEDVFERITALAAKIAEAPIALISLVDRDRVWFKSHHGIDVEQVDRVPGLCVSAIFDDATYVVEDAREDPRTQANPLVVGGLGLQFYAGVPLRTPEGYNLGMLCVVDREPRGITTEQTEQLKLLAEMVMDCMELRLAPPKSAEVVRIR